MWKPSTKEGRQAVALQKRGYAFLLAYRAIFQRYPQRSQVSLDFRRG